MALRVQSPLGMGRKGASLVLAALLGVYPAVANAQDGDAEPKPATSASGSASGTVALRDVLRMAVKASPDDKAAAARIARADAEGDAATAGYLPRIEGGARGGGMTERSQFLFRQDSFVLSSAYGEARGALHWSVYDFGRTSAASSAADAAKLSAEHGRAATRVAVARQAAHAYMTVLYDEQLVLSKKTAMKHRARFYAVARGLVEKGVRPAIDEQRAKVSLELARHDLTAAELRLAVDRARLAVQCGLDPDRLPALAPAALPDAIDDASHAVVAGEKRPEVASAVADVEAHDHRVDSAWAGHLPRLDVDVAGSYRMTQYDYADRPLPRAEASGVVSVTMPLFDLGIGARVDAARSDLATAQAREEAVRRRMRLEAYEAAVALKAARTLKARARELANTASAALAVVDARYASGLATSLELVDAEQSDIDAREVLLTAELRVQAATIELLAATGRAQQLEGT